MSWFHKDSPIGRSVNGVCDFLRTPVRAIIYRFNSENPRDERIKYTRYSKPRSYSRERPRSPTPLAFNASLYPDATGRKRKIQPSYTLGGSMSSPKRRKLSFTDSVRSPWGQQPWAQDLGKGIEPSRSNSTKLYDKRGVEHVQSSRSNHIHRPRHGDHGTPGRVNKAYYDNRRKRFTEQRMPVATLSKTRPVPYGTRYMNDNSSDASSRSGASRSPEKEVKSESILMNVPELSKKEETMPIPSIFSLFSVRPAEKRPITPPTSPKKTEEADSPQSDDEERWYMAYRDKDEEAEWTGFPDGPGASASPEPEQKYKSKAAVKPSRRAGKLVRTLFGRHEDPVQNSPGAFPRDDIQNSSSEDEAEDSDDASDSSHEQYRKPKPSKPSHRLRAAPAAAKPSTTRSYTLTNGFIGGTKRTILLQESSALLSTFGKLEIQPRRDKNKDWEFKKTERQTRVQKAKEEREAALARGEYALVPLSDSWTAKVQEAVRKGTSDGKYSPTDLARVVPEYASRHQASKWLNDAVINDYISLVARHGNTHDRSGQVPSFAALSSFFYQKIVPDPKAAPPGWTRRAKIPGKSLLECGMIFLPINEGMHWTLCVIEPKDRRKITMYNSMGHGSNERHARAVYAWVRHHVGAVFVEDDWTIDAKGMSPQQNNSDDCGVFTCTTARQLMLGMMERTPYDHHIMTVQRKRMIAELLNGGLIKADEG